MSSEATRTLRASAPRWRRKRLAAAGRVRSCCTTPDRIVWSVDERAAARLAVFDPEAVRFAADDRVLAADVRVIDLEVASGPPPDRAAIAQNREAPALLRSRRGHDEDRESLQFPRRVVELCTSIQAHVPSSAD